MSGPRAGDLCEVTRRDKSPGDSGTKWCLALLPFLCQPEVNHEEITPPDAYSVADAAGQRAIFRRGQKEFNICWTIYAGWMPWGTISNEKIIDKWASKYGIKIHITQLNDYIESINQYTAGQFDGCTMTNMDALTIPAAGGIDSTALITGSFSDGNDGVVLKGVNKKLSDLKGMSVYLPALSVSHYLLVRGLEKAGLQEKTLRS